jgi:hypothetical protein
MQKLFVVEWEEYEKGWGPRPDGYSVHVSEANRAAYVENYGSTPQSSIHSSMPLRKFEIDNPSSELLQKVSASPNGYVLVKKL